MNKSVHSGDYSAGSHSGSHSKKADQLMKDIEAGDINIQDFRDLKRNKLIDKTNTDRGHHAANDPLCQQSIREEQNEEDISPANAARMEATDEDYDIDLEEVEKKMQDELDDEVNKKFNSTVQGREIDEYVEDFDDSSQRDHDLKEDTILTEKVEQIVDAEYRGMRR